MRSAPLLVLLLLAAVALLGCHATMMRESPPSGATPKAVPTLAPLSTPSAVPTPTPVLTTAAVAEVTPVPTPRAVLTPTPVPSPAEVQDTPTSVLTMDPRQARKVVLAGREFSIELAITPEERQRGLSNRESLPADAGMLFVYEKERVLSFWMRETLIPLDILFIDREGRIVDIQTMAPEPGVSSGDLTTYRSAEPATYALEVNAGVADELGLMPGMEVSFQ